jgi:predicted secreted protein
MREAALELSGVVGRVASPEDNAAAVAAQLEIQKVRSLAEKARVQAKAPVLEYGKRIDAAAKEFVAELDEEMTRISRLIGDYQTLEQAKARAAEQARQAEIAKLEKEKAEAIAQAKSHEAVDAIQAHYSEIAQQTAAVTAPPQPVRAEGQVVKTDWNITVTNPYELAKFHPACVKIEARLSEIKQLLNDGITVKGITATKVTKASVRVSSDRKSPIEV